MSKGTVLDYNSLGVAAAAPLGFNPKLEARRSFVRGKKGENRGGHGQYDNARAKREAQPQGHPTYVFWAERNVPFEDDYPIINGDHAHSNSIYQAACPLERRKITDLPDKEQLGELVKRLEMGKPVDMRRFGRLVNRVYGLPRAEAKQANTQLMSDIDGIPLDVLIATERGAVVCAVQRDGGRPPSMYDYAMTTEQNNLRFQ